MITNSLMVVTMAIAFYVIPLILLVATALFIWRWRTRAKLRPRAGERGTAGVGDVPKDPVIVAAVLAVSGFAMVAFLTGSLGLGHYVRVPADAARVLGRAVTRWEDPLSSDSIALRGGVLIGLASTIVVVVSLRSYFRNRLASLDDVDVADGRARRNN